MVSQLYGLLHLLIHLVKLVLRRLTPFPHLMLLPQSLLSRRQSFSFGKLGSMHCVYHHFNLGRGSSSIIATKGEGSDLEELRGFFSFDEETLVDKLLVELLDFVLVQVVLLRPILHFSQSQQPAMLFAHDVEFHQAKLYS